MEYDRALYRVYERILEDLSQSAPIIEPRNVARQHGLSVPGSPSGGTLESNLNGGNSNGNVNGSVNVNVNGNGNDNDNDNSADVNVDSVENGTVENVVDFNHQISMRNSRSESRTVPFMLPLFMSPYSDALMEAFSNEGSWRRFWDTVRYNHHHHHTYHTHIDHDADSAGNENTNTNTNTNGRIPNVLRWISNIRESGTFSRVDHRNEQPIFRNLDNDGGDANASARFSSLDADAADLDAGQASLEMTTINASSGLRRRQAMRIATSPTNPTSEPSATTRIRRNHSPSSSYSSNSSDGDTDTSTTNASGFTHLSDRDRQSFLSTGSSSSTSSSSNGPGQSSSTSSSFDSTDPTMTPTTRMAQQVAAAHINENNNAPQQRSNRSNDNNSTEHDNEEREGCTQKGVFNFMRIAMIGGIFHLIVLIVLHTTYVGEAIKKSSVSRHVNTTSYDGIDVSMRKLLLEETKDASDKSPTTISRSCLEYALATRPPQQRSRYFEIPNDGDETNNNDNEEDKEKKYQGNSTQNGTVSDSVHEPPLLSENEILQIIILYGGKCTGKCSRVHKVHYSNLTGTNDIDKENDGMTRLMKEQTHENISPIWPKGRGGGRITASLQQHRKQDELDRNQLPNKHDTNEDTMMSSSEFWAEPDFKYASNEALMYLDNKMLRWHNVSIVNVTLTERCLNTGSDYGRYSSIKARLAQFLSKFYGMNTIIINQLMYGITSEDGKFRDGHVQNIATRERWSWSWKLMDAERNMRSDPFVWLSNKISVATASILAFFLVTSVTAVTVRVLTSSGVVIMFPIFALFRHFGLNGADDRILGFSYPWIGRARRAIHRQRLHPQSHFTFAHLAKLFLFYIMYEACQSTWSSVLYRRSIPANLPLWLFGYAMVWEYFSMIFVRSALSAHFFPRATLLYFVCYHIYFYSVPYGFFDVALIPWFLFMLHAMCFTIVSLEVPGSVRGVVSLECPREVYSRLSWPEWSASLPNEWSLFLPLNSRYIPLHDRQLGGGVLDEGVGDEVDSDTEVVTEETEMQAMNGDEASGGGEDLMLPLGSSDANTNEQPVLRTTI